METQKTVNHAHGDEREDDRSQYSPLTHHSLAYASISICNDERPNAFSNDAHAEDSYHYQHSDELGIVFTRDTVIEILAMMVEELWASSASSAVETALVHLPFAHIAIFDLVDFVRFLYAQNEIIDWIWAGQENVVVRDEQQQNVGNS